MEALFWCFGTEYAFLDGKSVIKLFSGRARFSNFPVENYVFWKTRILVRRQLIGIEQEYFPGSLWWEIIITTRAFCC